MTVSMDKVTPIVLTVVLWLLVTGIGMAAFPAQTHHAHNRILRSMRIISEQQAGGLLSAREQMQSRMFGIVLVIGSLFVLSQMSLKLGRCPADKPPLNSATGAMKHAGDAALHRLVVGTVGPAAKRHVGLVVAVIADDARDVAGFGRVSLDSDSPPDGDTVFEIGSVSKVFTGALLADSICRGDISLQTTVASLLPEFSGRVDAQASVITMKQLVTHTSGLPRTPESPFRPRAIWNAVTAGDFYRHYTEADLLNLLARKAPGSGTGNDFRYSNTGFGVLGYVLGRRSGLGYSGLINKVFAESLGMKHTAVQSTTSQEAHGAQGYRSYFCFHSCCLAQRSAPWNFPDCLAGAGGISSTANDMLLFLSANMGRTPSDMTPAMGMSHEVLFSRDADTIGMGWFHGQVPGSGQPMIWHNGGTGGFSSFLGFTADGRFGVCVLSNSARSVDRIAHDLLEAMAAQYAR